MLCVCARVCLRSSVPIFSNVRILVYGRRFGASLHSNPVKILKKNFLANFLLTAVGRNVFVCRPEYSSSFSMAQKYEKKVFLFSGLGLCSCLFYLLIILPKNDVKYCGLGGGKRETDI